LSENNDPDRDLGYLINWVEKNGLIFPKTYLAYDLSVYIPRISDRYLTIDYLETPENFAGYNPIYSSETKSEFHPQNINNFPDANKVMQNWINYMSSYHNDIENGLRIKEKYKLKFDNLPQQPKKITTKDKNEKIIEDLKKINEFYKSGLLSDEEFKKLKEKIINNN